jgi:hypothetical protein
MFMMSLNNKNNNSDDSNIDLRVLQFDAPIFNISLSLALHNFLASKMLTDHQSNGLNKIGVP